MMHIVGAGPAGAYFARLISDEIPNGMLTVYDQGTQTSCGIKPCAWVCYKKGLKKLLDIVYLDIDDYILSDINTIEILGKSVRSNLCSINKTKLLRDLLEGINVTRKHVTRKDINVGFIVDATGYARSMLPSTIKKRLLLKTYQIRTSDKMRNSEILYSGGGGYTWRFDMKNTSHIGCGYMDEKIFNESKNKIMNTNGINCECTSKICLSPPSECIPYVFLEHRKLTVGIGEAIGTVSPLTGKGIEFAMESALLLYESLYGYEHNGRNFPVLDASEYYGKIAKHFKPLNQEYKVLMNALNKNNNLHDLYIVVKNAYLNGVYIGPRTAFKMLNYAFS